VVDVRPVAFPPLDQVKPQLEEMMRQQEIAALQTKLRESATVK
jgi:peptidyl-prolyl cis-trans isomerase C